MKNPPKSWFPGFFVADLVAAIANPPPPEASLQMELDSCEWNPMRVTPNSPVLQAPT